MTGALLSGRFLERAKSRTALLASVLCLAVIWGAHELAVLPE